MYKAFIYHIVIFLCCFSFVVKAAPKINVVTEEWRPFNYTDDQGEVTGRATKRVKAILDNAGFDYQIKSYPWARSMVMATNLENTMIYTILKNQEREPLFQWVCPLIGPITVNLYKLTKRDDIKISTLEDAKNYMISIEKGESDHEYLLNQGFQNGEHLYVTSDPYAGARKFFAGRVDLVLQTEWEMAENLTHFQHSEDEVEKVLELKKASDAQGCLAFSLKTDKTIVEKVRQALISYNSKYSL